MPLAPRLGLMLQPVLSHVQGLWRQRMLRVRLEKFCIHRERTPDQPVVEFLLQPASRVIAYLTPTADQGLMANVDDRGIIDWHSGIGGEEGYPLGDERLR